MKKLAVVLALFMVAVAVAQSANQFALTTPGGPLTNCPTPVGAANILCSVNSNPPVSTDGYYVSVGGQAYAKVNVGAQVGNGVTKFNNRIGDVLPAANDYTFPMIQGKLAGVQMPSSMVCTISVNVGSGAPQTATISACN